MKEKLWKSLPDLPAILAGFFERFLAPEILLLLNILTLNEKALWVRRTVLVLFYGGSLLLCLAPRSTCRRECKMTLWTAVGTALLLVFSLTCLSREATFVYNQF